MTMSEQRMLERARAAMREYVRSTDQQLDADWLVEWVRHDCALEIDDDSAAGQHLIGALYGAAQSILDGAGAAAPSLGDRLAKLRLARALTQRELAQAVGVDERHISSWEHGHSRPYPQNRRKLATALGVTPDELMP